MDFFNILTMVGGLALFLYGMHLLSEGLEKLSGGRLERVLETDEQQDQGGAPGCGSDGGDSVFIGYHGHGCRFCQFGHYEAFAGDRNHHGRQCRNDDHLVGAQPDRD